MSPFANALWIRRMQNLWFADIQRPQKRRNPWVNQALTVYVISDLSFMFV